MTEPRPNKATAPRRRGRSRTALIALVSRSTSTLAFSSNYLDSLSATSKPQAADSSGTGDYLASLSGSSDATPGNPAGETHDDTSTTSDIPGEHYSKNHPMAGWAGYKHRQWGGYLDDLRSNSFEDGRQSDYGDDVRWGAEVYLNQIEE